MIYKQTVRNLNFLSTGDYSPIKNDKKCSTDCDSAYLLMCLYKRIKD